MFKNLVKLKKRLTKLDFLIYLCSLFFLLFISLVYFQFSASERFTDAFNSFVRANFMLKGRQIYSEIFSHHQPIMVFISYFIQKILHPNSLFQLVVYHRLFIIVFSFLANLILIARFRKPAVLFVFLFEISKYYLFGNLFLGESIVVYAFAYLIGTAFLKFKKEKIYSLEYFFFAFLLFFVIFTRIPYAPAALVVYFYLLHGKEYIKEKIISFVFLIIFSIAFVLSLPLNDYFYSLIGVNFKSYIGDELTRRGTGGAGLLQILFYPLIIFLKGEFNIMRFFLISLSITFFKEIIISLNKKNLKFIFFLIVTLALLSVRFVVPGDMFTTGFYLLPWYASFIMIIAFLLKEIYRKKFHIFLVLFVFLIVSFVLIHIVYPSSFVKQSFSINKTSDFHNNFGNQYIIGETIRRLSRPGDKLMVDYWETLIYWQSGLDSPYKYALFWPVNQKMSRYVEKRKEMFREYPPDFYYTYCDQTQKDSPLLYAQELSLFVQLKTVDDKNSCVYVNKNILNKISNKQWNSIVELGYKKP